MLDNKIIYKYRLQTDPEQVQVLDMPVGAIPLSVQMQNGALCLWVLADWEAPLAPRRFKVHVTGRPFTREGQGLMGFIGTVQDGPDVWHVFNAR